jgi:hypothetical protein
MDARLRDSVNEECERDGEDERENIKRTSIRMKHSKWEREREVLVKEHFKEPRSV